MSQITASDLLAVLGLLVLKREEDGTFIQAGTPPLWYLQLHTGDETLLPVTERFPFLEAWLPTAENFWASKDGGRIRSGEWSESTPGGKELPLRASAVVLEGEQLLLIEHVRSEHERMKGLLQTARENKLAHDEAAALKYTLRCVQARQRALKDLVGGRLLRVRKDGMVLERHPEDASFKGVPIAELVSEAWVEAVLEHGRKALQIGSVVSFSGPDGQPASVIGISDDEFWAALPA